MKKKILLPIIGICIALAFGAVSWFILPETVAVQIKADGTVSSTMPKLPAVLIPGAMSVIGGLIGILSEEESRKKGIALMFIGVFIQIISLVLNCRR